MEKLHLLTMNELLELKAKIEKEILARSCIDC